MPLLEKVRNLFSSESKRKSKLQAYSKQNIDPRELWDILGELGDGAFGKVYKVRHKLQNYEAALKQVEIKELAELDEFSVEIDILHLCKHKNIVSLYEDYFYDNKLWMYIEFCGGGALDSIMVDLEKGLTELQIQYVCRQMCEGLEFLHQNFVIHRDLKAGNVLLTIDGQVKLADFGVSAKNANMRQTRDTFIGTPYWMAPEVILCETMKDSPYSFKADIWSFGITLIELAEIQPPNHELHPLRVLIKIQKAPPPTLQVPSRWTHVFQDFIAKCLVKDPDSRPSPAELLEHAFIRNVSSNEPIIELLNEVIADVVIEERELDDNMDDANSSSNNDDDCNDLFDCNDTESQTTSEEPETDSCDIERQCLLSGGKTFPGDSSVVCESILPCSDELTERTSHDDQNHFDQELIGNRISQQTLVGHSNRESIADSSPTETDVSCAFESMLNMTEESKTDVDAQDNQALRISSESTDTDINKHESKTSAEFSYDEKSLDEPLTKDSKLVKPAIRLSGLNISGNTTPLEGSVPSSPFVKGSSRRVSFQTEKTAENFVRSEDEGSGDRGKNCNVRSEVKDEGSEEKDHIKSSFISDVEDTNAADVQPVPVAEKETLEGGKVNSGNDENENEHAENKGVVLRYKPNKPNASTTISSHVNKSDSKANVSANKESTVLENGREKPGEKKKLLAIEEEKKKQFRTLTKTRTFMVNGVVVKSQTSHVVLCGTENKKQQEHELWKADLRELKRLQKEENRQIQELYLKAQTALDELTKRQECEKQILIRNYDVELDQLNRQRQKETDKMIAIHNSEFRSLQKKLRSEQDRDLRHFKERLKQDMKLWKQGIEMLPKQTSREIVIKKREEKDIDIAEKRRKFEEQQHEAAELNLRRLSDQHRDKITLLDRQFLQRRHQILEVRESRIAELEERHIKEKCEISFLQLKDKFILMRQLMMQRNNKEIEQMKRINIELVQELVQRQSLELRRLPKILKSDSKTRQLMYKESLRVSYSGATAEQEKEKLKEFEQSEKHRKKQEFVRVENKLKRQMEERHSKNEGQLKELEDMHTEKQHLLSAHQDQKEKDLKMAFEAEMEKWKVQCQQRLQDLDEKCKKEFVDHEHIYSHNGGAILRASSQRSLSGSTKSAKSFGFRNSLII